MRGWNPFARGAALLAALLTLAGCGGAGDAASGGTQSAALSEPPISEKETNPAPEPSGAPLIPGIDAKHYPRVDGSTANMPLMAQVYSAVCGVPLEEAETVVEVTTTAPSWRRLADGACDLLLVYEPPESVKEELAESGAALEATPIGRDALVFLVNAQNQVDGLTQEQLRDIYTGKITDWQPLGGAAGPIAAFQRDAESGSQTLFLKLLMKDVEPVEPPTELAPGFMSDLIDGIALYDGSGGAIGYSVYYYAKEMYENPELKLLAVDGAAPSPQTIGDGSYPLVNDFYVVIRADEAPDSPARLLRDWILSDGGRQALVDAGYVPTL